MFTFRLTILFLLFFGSLLGQEKFDVFKLQEPKKFGKEISDQLTRIETREIKKNQIDCIYLENGFRSPNFLNTEKWTEIKDDVTPYKVEIVYSKYPIRDGIYYEIFPLLCKRIENLIELDPNLNNIEIQWNKVLQTNCENEKQINQLFHGAIIWYKKNNESELVENENEIQYKTYSDSEKEAINSFVSEQSSLEDIKKTIKEINQSNLIPDSIQNRISKLPFDEQLIQYKQALKQSINSNEGAFNLKTARKDEIIQITKEIDLFLNAYYTNDSVVSVVLERHPEWKNCIVINDWTGSMYAYGAQVMKWHVLNYEKSGIKSITLFNDGDDRPTKEKKLGETEGVYTEDANRVDNVLKLFQYVKLQGTGGDGPENNIEAILRAISLNPKADQVILIADNYSCIRDLELAELITHPLNIIVCGYEPKDGISADLVYLAKMTKGSIHLIENDIDTLNSVLVNNQEYLQLDSVKLLVFDSKCNNISTIGDLDSKKARNRTLNSLKEIRRNKDEVRKISLEALQLEKIPKLIFKIEELSFLDLSHNKIVEVPDKIGSLKKIRDFDLSHNSIRILPREFRKLEFLCTLNLSSNNFTSIPSSLAPLRFLRKLDLSNNRIKSFDKSLYFIKLEEMDLSNNEIAKITKDIGRLQELKILNLSNNYLTSLPANFVNLKKLQEVNLENNRLTSLPEKLHYFKQLRELNLKGNNFSEEEKQRIRTLLPYTIVQF